MNLVQISRSVSDFLLMLFIDAHPNFQSAEKGRLVDALA